MSTCGDGVRFHLNGYLSGETLSLSQLARPASTPIFAPNVRERMLSPFAFRNNPYARDEACDPKAGRCEVLTRYARGDGVGRARGTGAGLGVTLGRGFAVAVGVAVGVSVGVTTAVAVGVGVTVGLVGGVEVGVELGITEGVEVAMGVAVGVGPFPWTSNDPTSIRPSTTRSNPAPRWSNEGGGVKFGSPALMAGLPGIKACVNVGPPLSCNGPSSGFVSI